MFQKKLRHCEIDVYKTNLFICFYIRHVILSNDMARNVPKSHLMTETEWRNLGVQQSPGWVHYMMHTPGMVLLFYTQLRI